MNEEVKVVSYCYSSKCEIVETGFNIEKYWVCRYCHKEVTKAQKDRVEERLAKMSKRDKELSPEANQRLQDAFEEMLQRGASSGVGEIDLDKYLWDDGVNDAGDLFDV